MTELINFIAALSILFLLSLAAGWLIETAGVSHDS